MKISVGDVVDYILRNRGNKVFKEKTPKEIAMIVNKGWEDGTCIVATDEAGEICGVVTSRKDEENKILFVTHILTTHKNAFRTIVRRCVSIFGMEYTVMAKRRGVVKSYNTPKLVAKVLCE